MNPTDQKKTALNEVYNDINLLGYPRPFVYFCKGENCMKEHIEIIGESLDEWLTLFGKTAKEQGAERVYFFTQARFVNANLPKPVPLDDIKMAIHIFTFDMSDGNEIRANRSYIEYRNPGKKVKVSPEMFWELDTEDNLLRLFCDAYNSTEKEADD